MFAQARVAAGTGADSVDGDTVAAVLDAAVERFGPEFERTLGTCAIWLNGEPVDRTVAVGPSDEVAVLPPVSGGCG